MNYCGIDVSKGKSNVAIIAQDRSVLHEFMIKHDKEGFGELASYLDLDMKIGMEHTGPYSTSLFYFLKEKYNVCFVESLQMHNFARLHSRHVKNDRVDARLIAEYLSYGFEEVKTFYVNELKNLSRLYFKTIKPLSKYKCMFREELDIIFPELEKKFSILGVKALPNMLLKYPTPQSIANASDEELYLVLREHVKTGTIHSMKKTQKLKELARNSIGARNYPPSYLQYVTKLMLFFQELKGDLVKRMDEELRKTPYYRILSEFGYNTASLAVIVGEVGDIRRFSSFKKFVKYIGFDVAEQKSGSSISRQSYITKKGNRHLRCMFYNMVLVRLSYKRPPISDFFYRLKASGKHPKKCMVACARKLAVITYYEMMKCHDSQ